MPSPEPGADRPAGAGPSAAARFRTPYLQLSGGAVASKVLGAAREILLARFFGTGAVADAYRSGLTLTLSPAHFLTSQIVETCFVPWYSRARAEHPERAWALFQGLLLVSLAVGLLLAAGLYLLADPLVGIFLPGFEPQRREITAAILRILALGVPAYLYSALLSALGTAQRDFVIPSLRPALQNLGMIVMILAGVVWKRPVWIAYGFTGTYVALALWSTAYLLRRNRLPRVWVLTAEWVAPLFGSFWRLLRPLLPVAILLQANLLLERLLASLVGPGTVAALDYARFVTESTHALLIIPLGLISLTHFAGLDSQAARGEAGRMLGLVLLVFVPLSTFLLVNARPLLAVLFLRGAFDSDSLAASTRALVGLSTGLWAFGASHVLRRVLNARMRNGLVLAGEATSVALNAGFNLLFYERLGILALGLGPSLGALGSLFVYTRGLAVPREALSALRRLALTLPPYILLALLLRRLTTGFEGLVLQLLLAGLYWGVWIRIWRGR